MPPIVNKLLEAYMRSYYLIQIQGYGFSAVLLVDNQIVHRTSPSYYADLCGRAWVNWQWETFRKR